MKNNYLNLLFAMTLIFSLILAFIGSIFRLWGDKDPRIMTFMFANLIIAGNMVFLVSTTRSFMDPVVLASLAISAMMGGYIYNN